MILAFYGAGAMGREFKYVADKTGQWDEMVFIDDHAAADSLLGCPVIGFQTFRKRYSPEDTRFVITIGEPKFRREAFDRMTEAGYHGARLIHPSADICPDAELGEGAVVGPGVSVGSLAKVGNNFYAAKGASVGHDVIVGNHTRIGAGAFIGGQTWQWVTRSAERIWPVRTNGTVYFEPAISPNSMRTVTFPSPAA